jgi:hypothetical protein
MGGSLPGRRIVNPCLAVRARTEGAEAHAHVNPAEPPLPGKAEYDQAKRFALAFLRGQPQKATIATTLMKDRIQQLRS